jgi:hypothetical protein
VKDLMEIFAEEDAGIERVGSAAGTMADDKGFSPPLET